MLSRANILASQSKSLVSLAARCSASVSAVGDKSDSSNPLYKRLVRQEPGKVRLGFIPDEWFTFFYKKTGVTGPYAFGLGFTTYLVSKEWYIMDHEYYVGVSLLIVCIAGVKKLGPGIAKYLDKEIDDYEASLNENRIQEKTCYEEAIESEKKLQWSSEGQLMLVNAKRENVQLQLEESYRSRLMHAYNEVMQRLNYQTTKQNIERRIAQKHLVSWVLKNVFASITAEQENKNIDKCIADLAVLAKP